MCDKIYQDLPFTQKTLWKISVKKPAMSGYELFMKECMSAAIREQKEVRSPSCSGGYSCRFLKLGDPLDWVNFVGHAPPVPPAPPWPPGDPCEFCSGDTPSKMTCIIVGFTGDAAPYNATVVLPQTSNCVWTIWPPPMYYQVNRSAPGWDTFSIDDFWVSAAATFENAAGPGDCYEARTLAWVSGHGLLADQPDAIVTLETTPPE